MRTKLLLAVAVSATTLLTCSTALAGTTLVTDPDEPAIPADRDIESVAIDQPPTVGSPWVRITVKFRAPYSHTPCIYINSDRDYKLYNNAIHGGGPTSPVITAQTPAGAPDTVAYAFDASRIGNPGSFEWWMISCGGGGGDRVPDTGRLTHWVGPPLVGPVFP